MQINVREAAQLLNVPINTVYKWISDRGLPSQKVRDQFLINQSELLEWATLNRLPVSPEIFRDARGHRYTPLSFTASLAAGGLTRDIEGNSKPELFQRVVERLPGLEPEDRDIMLELMLSRESAGTTAVGHGIAIPHSRQPIVTPGAGGVIATFYLRQPLPFQAPDDVPVFALFVIVAPTVRTHLHLLARLSCALLDPQFREVVTRRGSHEELLNEAQRVEATFDQKWAAESPRAT